MNRCFLLFLFYFVTLTTGAQKLLTPKEFLGYELGDRFTPHYRVMEYFKHVSEVMPNIELKKYGETYEHRPLVYAIVTSPENFKNIEQIRLNNLKRTGIAEGAPENDKKQLFG